MGNMFSTRWHGVRTRPSTGGLPFLDMTRLRRMGALAPGAVADHTWTDGRGERIGAIRTHMAPARDALTLAYARLTPDGAWEPVRERIALAATPCRFGGHRLWFVCPDCGERRHVLYGHEARFRCRRCHDLAYPVTREDALDRSRRRERRLYARLGAERDGRFTVPDKPPGMQWRTYDAIMDRLQREQAMQVEALRAFLADGQARPGS